MYQDIINSKEAFFQEALRHFSDEIAKLRTGRATPSLVDHLLVDYYNTKTPIRQMANVTAPEPRLIVVQPWDRGALVMVESAIRESDLGLNPSNDGQVIRVAIPSLTEERRHDLVKTLNRFAEEARIAVRTIREDIWKAIQDEERLGVMSEDDKFRGKESLQEVVEHYNKEIETVREKKEREILTV